jgi:hypothetical protein
MREVSGRQEIRQSQLEEYLRVQDSLSELKNQQAELRQRLLWSWAQGATVEPGALSMRVTECEARHLTYEKVVEVLGEHEASRLRARIRPTRQQRLTVAADPQRMAAPRHGSGASTKRVPATDDPW